MTENRSPHKASAIVRRSIAARTVISVCVIAACIAGAKYSDVGTLPHSGYLYLVFGVMVLLSFLYVVGLRGDYHYPRRLLRLQLLLDFLVVTGIVASTGGIHSVFVFLYIIVVLEVGILLPQAESLLAASASSLLLGAMVLLARHGYLTPLGPIRAENDPVIPNLVVQIFALYLTAFISSYWSFRLHKIQAFQRGLLNNMSSGFVITDDSGIVRIMNVAAREILGYGPGEALGKESREVLRVIDGGADPMEVTFNTGEEFASHEVRIVRQDGAKILLGITTNVLLDHRGNSEGVIASFADLTEIERMRRELRNQDRLAAIGELAAGLAHEIRNPVAAIRGSVEELTHNLDEPIMARNLSGIAIRECDQLNRIVTGFLQFARSSTGAQQNLDLRGVLEEAITLLRRQAKGSPVIDIEYRSDDRAATVCTDRSQLKQAFLNIGNNALEAMSEGGKLDISLAVDEDDDRARISFCDSGVGIPPEEVDTIFEPFFTTKKHGFGMGLAVVQKIVSSHGGSVDISSEEKQGTTVTVTLPLKKDVGEPVALAAAC